MLKIRYHISFKIILSMETILDVGNVILHQIGC